MEKQIQYQIREEAKKIIDRHNQYHNNLEIEYVRNVKRIGNPNPKQVLIPDHWSIDRKFNPFYVHKHQKAIAKSIAKKLHDGTYTPHKPYIKKIPKKNGTGEREISIYQIPDAAVSNYLYRRLLSKNKHRFSSRAYAYRDDRNAHFAVQDISIELARHPRVFVSEFDFKDFFGSVDHDYLISQLDCNGFFISEDEKKLIKNFLNINSKGIPQGTSISLFLANLVCWKLDKRLEDEGLRYARYADDTIIWSSEYSKITKSFDIISDFSKEAKIEINLKKSAGISLLKKKDMPSEISQTKSEVEFLGYRLSVDKVGIKDASVMKIKKQISYLLYRNLIQPLDGKNRSTIIVPNSINNDPSFLTAIMQIRRFLYGSLNEDKLSKYLNGTYKQLAFKGIMSYYPLITDEDQLKELDSWLFNTILNSIELRRKKFLNRGIDVSKFFPYNCDRQSILKTCKDIKIEKKKRLLQIPSFMKIYKAIKKGLIDVGIEKTMNPNANLYDY